MGSQFLPRGIKMPHRAFWVRFLSHPERLASRFPAFKVSGAVRAHQTQIHLRLLCLRGRHGGVEKGGGRSQDQNGPFWPEEAHFGPFRSTNRTLAIPEFCDLGILSRGNGGYFKRSSDNSFIDRRALWVLLSPRLLDCRTWFFIIIQTAGRGSLLLFRGRHAGVEKRGGRKTSRMTPLPTRGFGPPSRTVRFPPPSGISALFFLYKNPLQSRPEALLEGSKNFRESAFSGTFSSPHTFCTPPYHGPIVDPQSFKSHAEAHTTQHTQRNAAINPYCATLPQSPS